MQTYFIIMNIKHLLLQRSPEKYMGQFGSDSYLYDFAKRSKDYMGAFGSDGYLYDFVKRGGAQDYMGQFGSDGYLYDFAKRSQSSVKEH